MPGPRPSREPFAEDRVRLRRREVVGQVVDAQDAGWPKQIGHAPEGDRLPEVGQVMQRVAREDTVDWWPPMLVTQEPGLNNLEVGEAGLCSTLAKDLDHG